jgi:hypothetical protein
MEGWFSRPREGEVIDGGSFIFKKASHLFQNFIHRDIFFSDKSLFCGVPDLAIDTVVGADFVRDQINSKRPPQSP